MGKSLDAIALHGRPDLGQLLPDSGRGPMGQRTAELRPSGRPHLTLALADVDYFKPINAALVEISRRLLRGTRADDGVGRQSGDEFATLSRCAAATARSICQRIDRAIPAEPIAGLGSAVVLPSIACWLAQMRDGMRRKAVFDSYDFALYAAM